MHHVLDDFIAPAPNNFSYQYITYEPEPLYKACETFLFVCCQSTTIYIYSVITKTYKSQGIMVLLSHRDYISISHR